MTDIECGHCGFEIAISGSEGQNEYTWCPCCGASSFELDQDQIIDSYRSRMSNKLKIDEKDVDLDDLDYDEWSGAKDDVRDFNSIAEEYEPSKMVLSIAKQLAKIVNGNEKLIEFMNDGCLSSALILYEKGKTNEDKKNLAKLYMVLINKKFFEKINKDGKRALMAVLL
jgi:hypothetical protein